MIMYKKTYWEAKILKYDCLERVRVGSLELLEEKKINEKKRNEIEE